jgi:hypothetical protein
VSVYGPRLRGNTTLEHQVTVTLLKEAYRPDGWGTGSQCVYREDLAMLFGDNRAIGTVVRGRTSRWEVDLGKETQRQVIERLTQGYAGCTDPIFFVTKKASRIRQLTKWAKKVPAVAPLIHFGLIDEVLADPYEVKQPAFQDIDGDYVEVFHNPDGPTGIAEPPLPPGH